MTVKKTVENAVQAKQEIENLVTQGYTHDDIYIFAHDKKRGDDITEALDTEKVGMSEQGFLDSMKNMFSSRGDGIRSKMEAGGLTGQGAGDGGKEVGQGKAGLVAEK